MTQLWIEAHFNVSLTVVFMRDWFVLSLFARWYVKYWICQKVMVCIVYDVYMTGQIRYGASFHWVRCCCILWFLILLSMFIFLSQPAAAVRNEEYEEVRADTYFIIILIIKCIFAWQMWYDSYVLRILFHKMYHDIFKNINK